MGSHGGSRAGSSGGGGGISASFGKLGTGLQYTMPNGRTVNYIVTNDGLRRIDNADKIKTTLSAKEFVQKAVDSGKGKFLSKNETDNLRQKRQRERAETPDYELGVGTPWGNRGASKSVYRPRRNR